MFSRNASTVPPNDPGRRPWIFSMFSDQWTLPVAMSQSHVPTFAASRQKRIRCSLPRGSCPTSLIRLTSRAIWEAPTILPAESFSGEIVSDTITCPPFFAIRTVSKCSMRSPARKRCKISASWACKSGGMRIVIGFPRTSCSVYPKIRSALRFQVVIMPFRSFATIASSEVSTMAASLERVSSAASAMSIAWSGSPAFFIGNHSALISLLRHGFAHIIQDGTGLSQHRTAGNHEFDERSRMCITQPQLSAKFFGALFHAADPHSNAVRLKFLNFSRDSLAIVPHRNHNDSFPLSQCDPYFARFGMPENIGERLLNDAEDCGLYLGAQPRKIARLHVESGFYNASLGEPLHRSGKRRQQADFIEQRRMQQMRHGADLLNGAVNNE